MKKYTITILVYNMEEYLIECIDRVNVKKNANLV